MIPLLASGSNFFDICGSISLTLTCLTDPSLPFTVTGMNLPTDTDRGVLSLSIDDSLYAIDNTDPSNVIYEKEYVFKLEAEFDIYPELPALAHLEYNP